MGKFNELKITQDELAASGMTSLPGTKWKDKAEILKAKLDGDGTFVAGRLGQILDVLEEFNLPDVPHSPNVKYVRLNGDKVLETSKDGVVWEATGSSGHIILDKNGNALPQRSRLKFQGTADVTDSGTETVISGIKGDKGDKGDAGLKGDKGDTGEQGDLGPVIVPVVDKDGVMSFSVQLTSNAPASVSVRGPQGPQGVQGSQGAVGAAGTQGVQGIQGVQGLKGDTGIKGDKGDTGASGLIGTTGLQGIQGIQGERGPQGVQGMQGTQGVQGATGAQGDRGNPGADGRSFTLQDVYPTLGALKAAFPTGNEYAYQVSADKNIYIYSELTKDWFSLGQLQGPQGAQGIQGVQGVKGDKGDQGATGSNGAQGIQGIQGAQGLKGDKGDVGEQGLKGDTGDQGVQGIQGVQGVQGEKGIQGVQGTAGKSAYTIAMENAYVGAENTFNTSLAAVPGHVVDETKHLTAGERAAWNDKVDNMAYGNGQLQLKAGSKNVGLPIAISSGGTINSFVSGVNNFEYIAPANNTKVFVIPIAYNATKIVTLIRANLHLVQGVDYAVGTDGTVTLVDALANGEKIEGTLQNTSYDSNDLLHKEIFAGASHTHGATAITQDATHRFVTDAQVNAWKALSDGVKNGMIRDLQIMMGLALGTSNMDAWADLLSDITRLDPSKTNALVSWGTAKNHKVSQLSTSSCINFGYDNNSCGVGQVFTATAHTLTKITVKIDNPNAGSATDGLTMKVYNQGINTLIATATNVIPAASVTGDIVFNFSNAPLVFGTAYRFVVTRTGALSGSQFYRAWYCTTSGGGASVYNSSGGIYSDIVSLIYTIEYSDPIELYWNVVTLSAKPAFVAVSAIQTLNTGTITYYVSENGTTWVQILALNTAQAVSFTTKNLYLKAVITGNAQIDSVAWGGN